ncbi:SAM-dependent methyltransferase [Micromonospora sp. NPDC050397]|uniref:SAM-dependent methyltransferase n=1 Tax=Micromonospora sp. NPDC050397 TaxID=3364279 RepID=UPI00384AA645
MNDSAIWLPTVDGLELPNAARMYDYFLGGAHNFAVDRAAADEVIDAAPEVRDAAKANRSFLRRSVSHALDNGIRQFLDLGSGIPTVGNVHEIAHALDPSATVVYVDSEPVAVAHARALLRNVPTADAIQGDIRYPARILGHDQTRYLIDFDQPVAMLLVSVLHFVPGDVAGVVDALRQRMVAGSYLIVSHASPVVATAQTRSVEQLYARTSTPLYLRGRDEIRALFGDLALVHPMVDGAAPADLTPVPCWRPDPGAPALPPEVANSPFIAGFLAGVGRVPSPLTRVSPAAPLRPARALNHPGRFGATPTSRLAPLPTLS